MEKINLSKNKGVKGGDLNNKENLGLKNESNEVEAKKKFEEIFDGFAKRYSRIGIVEGAKYADYMNAMKELDFLDSDLEKLDVINFTAASAMESSIAHDRNTAYEIHRFYMDRSARILGVFLHDVLSKMNEQKMGLSSNKIFFINPNNILNVDPKIPKKEKIEKENKIAEILLKGEKDKKIINIIVDEFIARGDGVNQVRSYFNKVCNDHKTKETGEVLNTAEGFYTRSLSPQISMYRKDMEEPSWCRESKVSGVIEQTINKEEIIVPLTSEEGRLNVEKVRKSLRRASSFVANIVKNGLENSFNSNSEPIYSILSYEEKKMLEGSIRGLMSNLINCDMKASLTTLNDIKKHAELVGNNELISKIPGVEDNLRKIEKLDDINLDNKKFIDLYKAIRDILEPYA